MREPRRTKNPRGSIGRNVTGRGLIEGGKTYAARGGNTCKNGASLLWEKKDGIVQ